MASVDFHQHLWPQPFVRALRTRREPPMLDRDVLYLTREPASVIDLTAHTLERRVELLDRDGIDVAIISLQTGLGIDLLPETERHELVSAWEEGIEEMRADAGGRLRTLAPGGVLAGHCGACVRAEALLELDAIASLLDDLQEQKLPLFVHPGRASAPAHSPAWWVALVDYVAGMQRAHAAWLAHGVIRWPRLNVVFAMLAGGAPFQIERFQSRGVSERDLLAPTVYFETSSYGRRALDLVLATCGVSQVVYGSDAPVIETTPTLRAVRGFGESLAEYLLVINPNRVLP